MEPRRSGRPSAVTPPEGRSCLHDITRVTSDPLTHQEHLGSFLQEVMSVEEESTSCYCLLDPTSCHLLLDQPGSYALVGEPLTQAAVKRLKLAVFGSMEVGAMSYSLRVYCVDDTPHAFQVGGGWGMGGAGRRSGV